MFFFPNAENHAQSAPINMSIQMVERHAFNVPKNSINKSTPTLQDASAQTMHTGHQASAKKEKL